MRVLLVCMPFASLDAPALGLSTLKAGLLREGMACDVRYFNVAMAERIGRSSYEAVCNRIPHWSLAGEWAFTHCLYGDEADPGTQYVDEVLRKRLGLGAATLEVVLSARAAAPALIEQALRDVAWDEYDVVGFTSSNAQNVASLALARRVKEQHPGLHVVFGGANWQGCMGLEAHKQFPFVDFACSGEADESFIELLHLLARDDRQGLDSIPGVVWRARGRTRSTGTAPPVMDLDALPVPDHGDFFRAIREGSLAGGTPPMASVESSRGCWWAGRNCCRFCALNASGRAYRTKSPQRILGELRELARTWDASHLCLTDNVVSPGFMKVVLPELARDPLPMPLFLDVRPDVTREQVRLLGRIQAIIQPGIESLNDHALEIMGKGSDALENIRLLKWCRLYGVQPYWNILHGFPGEADSDYEATLEMLPSLRFLRPPESCARFRLDRFSPFADDPQRFGLTEVRPLPVYAHLYPFSSTSLGRLAGSFAYRCGEPLSDPVLSTRLEAEVRDWKQGFSHASVRLVEGDDGALSLRDDRRGADRRVHVLDALDRLLYEACEDIAERSQLSDRVEEAFGTTRYSESEVDDRLESFVERRLMVRIRDRFLSLALPEGSGWLYARKDLASSSAGAALSDANTSSAALSGSAASPERPSAVRHRPSPSRASADS
jgi:ribosomal peptide maturation radical SAM protein 1